MSRLRAAASALLGRSGDPLAITAPASLLEHARHGTAPLADGATRAAQAPVLSVAVVVPAFRRGSGGHRAIADLVRGLEQRGHRCSLWISDEERRHAGHAEADVAAQFAGCFGAIGGPVRLGFARWEPVDVAVATGWQTVARVLLLEGAKARAYVVLDHEPEFYATSAEREWAAWTYRQGLHVIAASAWLAGLVRERYGAGAQAFEFGIDHETYRPLELPRRDDRVLFYARAVTARRAVPLGLLALAELHRRRPGVAIALFGESRPLRPGFPAQDLGVLAPQALARAYAQATVGVVLSMTNASLIGPEMLACGLPVVELDAAAMRAGFGSDGPMLLAPFDPLALADAIELLLDDRQQRARRVAQGLALAAGRTWSAAAATVETGLREALTRPRA
ncbi:MAG TPA: glycosyltransferase family 4 protein [Solirubrobacteraceae bacterium]|nr:glycosyltransferase family 4 protein [Solirubrobacteraceae bacterium]